MYRTFNTASYRGQSQESMEHSNSLALIKFLPPGREEIQSSMPCPSPQRSKWVTVIGSLVAWSGGVRPERQERSGRQGPVPEQCGSRPLEQEATQIKVMYLPPGLPIQGLWVTNLET